NHAIRYLYGGQVITLAGQQDNPGFRDGTETSAQFHMPMDIEIQDDGSLIIADTYNHKIRKLTPFSFPNEFPENENELKVVWNSKLIPFDSPPEIMDGRVMTPIR